MWNNKILWTVWLTLTLMMTGYFSYSMTSDNQSVFIPGETSHGHYQIELKCNACHGKAFDGRVALQKACMDCHGIELKEADDKHPKSKFTDPRNAARTAVLDARYCVTCHVEHKPAITREMGVTVAADVCHLCHFDIAKDRKSHKGMAFDTCDNAGCHNFHDNRALYEDFLLKHQDEKKTYDNAVVSPVSSADTFSQLNSYPKDKYPVRTLKQEEKDAPTELLREQLITQDWHQTTHAQSGVNCSACHLFRENSQISPSWTAKPTYKVCEQCHSQQVKGFLESRHGMRIAQQLSPMSTDLARQPMRKQSYGKTLDCTSCHSDHKFDIYHAAVDACLSCHNDKHSLAYKESKHYQLWLQASSNDQISLTGVSCATCHLPRTAHKNNDRQVVLVQHNQNDNLRPNEKMIRTVCMHCHGLAYSIDALADSALVSRNFSGSPGKHINGVEMAKTRAIEKQKEKESKSKNTKHVENRDDGFL